MPLFVVAWWCRILRSSVHTYLWDVRTAVEVLLDGTSSCDFFCIKIRFTWTSAAAAAHWCSWPASLSDIISASISPVHAVNSCYINRFTIDRFIWSHPISAPFMPFHLADAGFRNSNWTHFLNSVLLLLHRQWSLIYFPLSLLFSVDFWLLSLSVFVLLS